MRSSRNNFHKGTKHKLNLNEILKQVHTVIIRNDPRIHGKFSQYYFNGLADFLYFSLGYCYFYALGIKKSYPIAISYWKKSANFGNVIAQYYLGLAHYLDRKSGASDQVSLKWFLKAAKRNHPQAQYFVGRIYELGEGVEVDTAEALKWFQKAIRFKNSCAENSLANLYEKGLCVKKNDQMAFKLYLASAIHGDELGQYNLGLIYLYGDLKQKKSFIKARYWLTKSAEQGYYLAKRKLRQITGHAT